MIAEVDSMTEDSDVTVELNAATEQECFFITKEELQSVSKESEKLVAIDLVLNAVSSITAAVLTAANCGRTSYTWASKSREGSLVLYDSSVIDDICLEIQDMYRDSKVSTIQLSTNLESGETDVYHTITVDWS